MHTKFRENRTIFRCGKIGGNKAGRNHPSIILADSTTRFGQIWVDIKKKFYFEFRDAFFFVVEWSTGVIELNIQTVENAKPGRMADLSKSPTLSLDYIVHTLSGRH